MGGQDKWLGLGRICGTCKQPFMHPDYTEAYRNDSLPGKPGMMTASRSNVQNGQHPANTMPRMIKSITKTVV